MTCCVCKVYCKRPGYQLCDGCLRKFATHINQEDPKPFLEARKPEPTPDIRGRNGDGSGRGVDVPVEKKAAHA